MLNEKNYFGNRAIGLISRVFANSPGDRGSIPHWVIPKTEKMVLDATLLSTQHHKKWMKGKVEQTEEWSSAPLHLGVAAFEKGAFGTPTTKVANNFYVLLPARIEFEKKLIFN